MPLCPKCKNPLKSYDVPVCHDDYYCAHCLTSVLGSTLRLSDEESTTSAVEYANKSSARRLSWDDYFMQVAQIVATRATCPRKSVGCVLVRDRMIISTGYNGAIRGMPHCADVGCMMENDHCVAVIHAELNSIIQAARNGVVIEGADCYVTASPCWNCFKALANAGVKRIVYGEFYRDDRIFEVAEKLGIAMVGPKE